MSFTTDTPYQHDMFIVKRLGDHTAKIVYCASLREAGWEDSRTQSKKASVNTEKLANNISRAKTTISELVLCNPWDYWCTLTLDKQKFNRYNLNDFSKEFSIFVRNYNRKCTEEQKVKYILVPEKHKDGAWHMHGFLKGIHPDDLIINKNGYLTWKQYQKRFGYISIDKIKHIDKASNYIRKYITKDLEKSVTDLNRHLYYASKGLKRAEEVFRGRAHFHGTWDWEHEEGYCKVKTIDTRITDLSDYLEIL